MDTAPGLRCLRASTPSPPPSPSHSTQAYDEDKCRFGHADNAKDEKGGGIEVPPDYGYGYNEGQARTWAMYMVSVNGFS